MQSKANKPPEPHSLRLSCTKKDNFLECGFFILYYLKKGERLMQQSITTAILCGVNQKEVLTGEENYSIVGRYLPLEKIEFILTKCKGLKRNWNCLEKALIAMAILKCGRIAIGSLMLDSIGNSSNFGFYYNPPLEFHAWIEFTGGYILDLSLPGVIENGSNTKDKYGYVLVGREPVILNGKPESWMHYEVYEYLN